MEKQSQDKSPTKIHTDHFNESNISEQGEVVDKKTSIDRKVIIKIRKTDRFILLLPIITFFGYVQMNDIIKPIPFDEYFDRECEAELEGRIDQIVEKENSISYTINHVCIYPNRETKLPIKEKIIVYVSNKEYLSKNEQGIKNNEREYKVGNQVHINGTIMKLSKPTNEGQFDSKSYYIASGVRYLVYAKSMYCSEQTYSKYVTMLCNLRNKLSNVYTAILPNEEAGILKAMLLGEKDSLDTEIKELYQKNGIAHILAISGLHISFLSMLLYRVLKKVGLSLLVNTAVVTVIVLSYGEMTNFSVSTNRAIVMFLVSLFAIVIGRTYDMLSAISLSACIILVQNPMQLYQAGFQLSFLAVLVIAICIPLFEDTTTKKDPKSDDLKRHKGFKDYVLEKLIKKVNLKTKYRSESTWIQNKKEKLRIWVEDYLDKKKKLSKINKGKAIRLSLIISAATAPIIAYSYSEIPLYSVLLNIIVIPLMSVVLVLGVLSGITGLFCLGFGEVLGKGIYCILTLYEVLCQFFAKLPFHLILVGKPTILRIILYYIIVCLIVWFYFKKNKKYSLIILAFLWIILIKFPSKDLKMTMLDVSQGDCIYLMTPTGKTMLIDGGSSDIKNVGKYRIKPYLKSKRVMVLDYVAITHMDSDHMSGIKELLEEMPDRTVKEGSGHDSNTKSNNILMKANYNGHIIIKNLILSKTSMVDETYEQIEELADVKGVHVYYFGRDDFIKDGEVTIRCLHPYYEYQTNSLNDTSLVFDISYKHFSALLLGDLEAHGEEELIKMKQSEKNQYTLLKIAHHGAKSSSTQEFLSVYQAKLGIISCGYGNRYGHPSKQVLQRLKENGMKPFITMEQGAFSITTDGTRVKIIK